MTKDPADLSPTGDGDGPLMQAVAGALADDGAGMVGVALSGGGDSMALLDLARRVQIARGRRVCAVTVDHRLRPESADEARLAAGQCAAIGVSHQILVWDHGAIAGNLQDQARRARYSLIGDWARGRGISHVLLGHTADDQAETFLMGLARGAGLDGLSGMRARWTDQAGITWVRPLLGITRNALRDHLTRRGIGWTDDPSNDNDRFTRVKARRVLAALAPLGITGAGLATVAGHLAQAQAALQQTARDVARRIASERAGGLTFDRAALLAEPPEIGRRLLIAALRFVSGAGHPPRQADLARLMLALADGRHATLMGCRIRTSDSAVQIQREERAVRAISTPTTALWDGRWRLTGPHHSTLTARALGSAGLALCPDWRARGLARALLLASPAIWQENRLIAAPLAGFGADWDAEVCLSFDSFLLSH